MNKKLKLISYVLVAFMLSTSIIYFVVTYQQLTDESAPNFHEFTSQQPENQQLTSDLDRTQWNEIDFASKVQTMFFVAVGIAYVPVGIWMLIKKGDKRPYVIAFGGSLSLIVLYAISRTINLPIVGLQNDIGTIDIASKILQGCIIGGSSYLLVKIGSMKTGLVQ